MNILYEFDMKGDRTRKKHGFRPGHTPLYRKQASSEDLVEQSTGYIRLPRDLHEIVSNPGPGVDPTTNATGSGSSCRLLRPRGSQQSELELASENKIER